MRGGLVPLAITGAVAALLFSTLSPALSIPPATSPSAPASIAPAAPAGASSSPSSSVLPQGNVSATSELFDQRVLTTASALAAAGVPGRSIRVPYVGPSAEVVNGAVVPGYAVSTETLGASASSRPAPVGIAYYGEDDPSGSIEKTTVDASSLQGSLTVDQIETLYLDADAPAIWGIQLNAVLGNVTLHGVPGYEYWVQNAVEVYQQNGTLNLGEDTWNFSAPGAVDPTGTSTILSHSPNGSIIAGVYLGYGPWLHVAFPFNLTLYLNSSLTPQGDQELWYNYSLSEAGGGHAAGNYDWVVFNTGGPSVSASIAPLVANGERLDPVGLPNDFELDFGIGGFNGETMDVLSGNLSATLGYCPLADAPCTLGQYRPVPAAVNYGGETGETGSGLAVTFEGTSAFAHAGPFVLRGLWGYAGAAGSASGATAVANAIDVSGEPDRPASTPYVFVFFSTDSSFDTAPAWSPDVAAWYLPPGTYQYEVLLADYAEVSGNLTVGASPTELSVNLTYHPASGVYTPLWAFGNAQLAAIATSGNGTIDDQYLLFNNPTYACSDCDGARNAQLAPLFFSTDGYLYPTFPGILLVGTDAYVDVDHPPSFCSYDEVWGLIPVLSSLCFDLQLEFVSTEHVTLAHDDTQEGWPGFLETLTLAGVATAAENPFPEADVMFWNASDDLVMGNDFAPAPLPPPVGGTCFGLCASVPCYSCSALDALLLYGGTNNTVWGNTFHDPAPTPGTPTTAYTGLAEAESGDLIYNNNFSIDNPTVYLPFDVFTDACPIGYAGDCGPLVPPAYADSWNVSSQPASAVSATVNGFPLSGSVLGPTCGVQGGNYWSDYGNPLNPVTTLPFTNRYNYSEILVLLPPGSNPVQSSIRVGGDALPLSPGACTLGPQATVLFQESGLPKGDRWQVELAGGFEAESTSATIAATVVTGTLFFEVLAPSGFAVARLTGPGSPTYDSASVTGPTTLSVQFGALEVVAFVEKVSTGWPGLGANASWAVSLTPTAAGGPPSEPATEAAVGALPVQFLLAHGGAYRFVVSKPAVATVSGGHGTFTVPSHPLTKVVKFRPLTSTVKFEEHGLPAHTDWSVAVTPVSPAGPVLVISGAKATLEVALTNGSYVYAIAPVGSEAPTPSSGSLAVAAPLGLVVQVHFAPDAGPSVAPQGARDAAAPVGVAVADPSGVARPADGRT